MPKPEVQFRVEGLSQWGNLQWDIVKTILEEQGATSLVLDQVGLTCSREGLNYSFTYIPKAQALYLTASLNDCDSEWLEAIANRIAGSVGGRQPHDSSPVTNDEVETLPEDLVSAIISRHAALTSRAKRTRSLGDAVQWLGVVVFWLGIVLAYAMFDDSDEARIVSLGILGFGFFSGGALILRGTSLRVEGDRLLAEADTAVGSLSRMPSNVLRRWLERSGSAIPGARG